MQIVPHCFPYSHVSFWRRRTKADEARAMPGKTPKRNTLCILKINVDVVGFGFQGWGKERLSTKKQLGVEKEEERGKGNGHIHDPFPWGPAVYLIIRYLTTG